jgi:hypothetical protein
MLDHLVARVDAYCALCLVGLAAGGRVLGVGSAGARAMISAIVTESTNHA